MPELQITQEYLGFSNHLVFLSPMWEEYLNSDTYCRVPNSTVAKTTDGSIFNYKMTAIAGVANIGEDSNWCGHHFAQANWYAFGRLAWNNQLASEQIADEWIRMTFSKDNGFVEPIKTMMLTSHETTVNYMMPLGLHHIFAWDHHYILNLGVIYLKRVETGYRHIITMPIRTVSDSTGQQVEVMPFRSTIHRYVSSLITQVLVPKSFYCGFTIFHGNID